MVQVLLVGVFVVVLLLGLVREDLLDLEGEPELLFGVELEVNEFIFMVVHSECVFRDFLFAGWLVVGQEVLRFFEMGFFLALREGLLVLGLLRGLKGLVVF